MNKILCSGNYAAAEAVKYANVDVVAGYPITPSTKIVEKINEDIAQGLKCKFISVEGEHSAMAATVAASAAGARVFTATSSQGLLYMHEVLHMAAGGRLPIVMVNVNRGVFAPWTLKADHQDALSQRDTGWIQIYCASNQEIFNAILQAYKIAETTYLPVMVNFDGFLLSHCEELIYLPEKEKISEFLPDYKPMWFLDTENPTSFSNVTNPNEYSEFRKKLSDDIYKASSTVKKAAEKYKEKTGLWDGDTIETFQTEDAEIIMIGMGSLASELKQYVNLLRNEGVLAGLIRIRTFIPFPAEEIMNILNEDMSVLVIDRNYHFGAREGIIASELRNFLYGKLNVRSLKGIVAGIGGIEMNYESIRDEVKKLREEEE